MYQFFSKWTLPPSQIWPVSERRSGSGSWLWKRPSWPVLRRRRLLRDRDLFFIAVLTVADRNLFDCGAVRGTALPENGNSGRTNEYVPSVGVKEGLSCVFCCAKWRGKARNLALPWLGTIYCKEAVKKRTSLAIFWLLYSWFTDLRCQTSAVQQSLACSFFHSLTVNYMSWYQFLGGEWSVWIISLVKFHD